MAFCSQCGTDIGNAAFCSSCGAKVGINMANNNNGGFANPVGSVRINNLTENPNIEFAEKLGCFEIYEYKKDISVDPSSAIAAYFMQEMNFRKRQVLCRLEGNAIKTQAGAMQWMAGRVTMDANIKGLGDFIGKAFKGAASGESASKPVYAGNGYVMLEPTFRYIILEDLSNWGSGMVLEDGMFLACDATIQEEIISRKNFSSAILGGEGLFNLSLSGNGIAVLESAVPREELIEIVLENEEVRIDGNMAVAWSKSLEFTVEKSTKSAFGSLASGEGFVNVYRGTGRILMSPIGAGTLMKANHAPKDSGKSSSAGIVGSVASSLLDL